MKQTTRFLSFRKAGAIVMLLAAFTIGILLIRNKNMNDQWNERSMDFVNQVNSLGTNLPSGEVGIINLPPCGADELILLPAYCTREELVRQLPDHQPQFLNDLIGISRNDRISPALVWIRNGEPISINHVKFAVGIKLTLKRWKLHGPYEIKIIKEKHSPNDFQSISFVGDN